MTTTRYLFAKIAMAFGISRRQRRMAEAASETHLLREAEQILGQRLWENVESIEELGIEYWNLRRLTAQRDELRKQMAESEQLLAEAHEQRAALLSAKAGGAQALEERRRELLLELETHARQRDAIVAKAREIRRVYDGLKAKLDVLRTEQREHPELIEPTRERMKELRGQFDELKSKRDTIAVTIEGYNRQVDALDQDLDEARKRHREEAAEAFQLIGEANRRMSTIKARIGLIETEMQQLFGEIGRHVSRHIASNPGCRAAARAHRPMVEVMSALRKSINLNHRLAGV